MPWIPRPSGGFDPDEPLDYLTLLDASDLAWKVTIGTDGALTTALVSAYAAVILADTPVGYWRLDETSGASAKDASGNGWDGAYTGTWTLGVAGATSDGGTAVTSAAAASRVSLGEPHVGFTAVTVELWIKTTSTAAGAQLLSADTTNASGQRSWQFRLASSGVLEFVKIANGTATVTGATAVNDGAWHHVAATYDGTTIRLYVDGVEDATGAASGAITPAGGVDPLTLGDDMRDGAVNGMVGSWDEAVLFDYALSATRVAAHHAAR